MKKSFQIEHSLTKDQLMMWKFMYLFFQMNVVDFSVWGIIFMWNHTHFSSCSKSHDIFPFLDREWALWILLFVFGLAFCIISQVFTWDLLFERGLLVVISANLWNKRWPPFIHHMVESRIRRVDSAIDDLGRDRKKILVTNILG